MSSLETKPSLESYKLAEQAVNEELSSEENNSLLKEYWIKLGDQLEMEGIPKEKISTVATTILLEKKSEKLKIPKEELRMSGYFYRVYSSKNWTNSFFSRNTNEEKESVPLGEQENTSNGNNKKSNLRIIDYLKRTKSICDVAIKKFLETDDLTQYFSKKKNWKSCHMNGSLS